MANERIFISYKRVNKEPVFALIDRIERELGVKCWVDLDGIETSAQFASKICTAIDRAEVVLFMHSSAHLDIDYDNDWTIRELNYAHDENKHVVLVKLDDAPLKNIFKLIYGTRNNIDSRNPDQWNIMIRDLRKWLNIEEPTKAQTAPSRPQQTPQKPQPAPQKSQPTPPKTPPKSPTTQPTPPKISLKELEERLARLDKEVGDLEDCIDFSSREWKYGFKDKTGKVVIPCKWHMVSSFREGLALVTDFKDKSCFIDKTGKVIIPCAWECANDFREGLAAIHRNGRWGFIDKTGKEVIPCTWKWAMAFHEGLARVQDFNEKFGFIDKIGKVVIPCTWYSALEFNEGLAAVYDFNKKGGYIDKTGKVVIPCKWNNVQNFKYGKATVEGKVGLFGKKDDKHTIDKTGKVIG